MDGQLWIKLIAFSRFYQSSFEPSKSPIGPNQFKKQRITLPLLDRKKYNDREIFALNLNLRNLTKKGEKLKHINNYYYEGIL